MTSFAYTRFPAQHPGVERASNAWAVAQQTARRFEGARGAASLLLAAVVSAVLVVANQVIDNWADGHVMAAWMALWLIAFAALALFAVPSRQAVQGLRVRTAQWRAARKQAREDRKLWALAMNDARVMADISRALSQQADRIRAYN